MTYPIDGISAVLTRISQLQAQFPQLVPASARLFGTAPSTGGAASSSPAASTGTGDAATSFAAQLSAASNPSLGTGSTGVTGNQVVASAEKYLGVPYVFGGTTSAGIDCSGLVQRAYGDLGIQLPRLSWDQAKTGTAVPDLAHAQPGDILGFGNPAEHVAIYLGNNTMIAAPQPGENVKIQSVYETPASIRRIVTSDTSPAGAGPYVGLFAQNEATYKLPSGLLAAVAQTESGGDPTAISPAGAQGLMQLMPATAAGLGVNPWEPGQAIQGAAELLANYLRRFGSVPLALAAYNAGPGAVEQYGGIPPYTETQNYVRKITAMMASS
ncbi:MAG: lytic transglycosylase [Frankiales bacterium]|nr:lytic transglycosylase [Frankiales bacterium]